MAVGNRKVQEVSNVLDFLPVMENHFSWKATLFTSIILKARIMRQPIKTLHRTYCIYRL